MDITKDFQNTHDSVDGISFSRRESISLITKLELLLDKIVMCESCPISVEDAFAICTELLHLSKSQQWLQYKNSILNDLMENYARERLYLQENNELQNNCLNLYKNCQNLEERLQNAMKITNNNMEVPQQQQLKLYSMYDDKRLIELLRKQKSSLIHNMEALTRDKRKFLIDLSNNNGIYEYDLNEIHLTNSIGDLRNELRTYKELVELKEEAFEKLKRNFQLNMSKVNIDVDDIHAMSIKYHELIKQKASEIVQLKHRVYQIQEQIEQIEQIEQTTIGTESATVMPNDHKIKDNLGETNYIVNNNDGFKYFDVKERQNIYDLMKHLKISVRDILQINKTSPSARISSHSQLQSIGNIHFQVKCTTNDDDEPFKKHKSIQTEDDWMIKQKKIHDEWDKLVQCLEIAQKTEADLKQELELKTMELENLNHVFIEQNEHLRKLEKYSMTLELKCQHDIANVKKSFQTEMAAMREELDFCHREMQQQTQLLYTLQQAPKLNKTHSKEEMQTIKYKQRVDNIEHRRQNRENLQMLEQMKTTSTTDDNLTILNKLLKTEYNRKVDYSCQKLPKTIHSPVSQSLNKGHSKDLGKYSEKFHKEILDSKIKLKSVDKTTEWFEIDATTNDTPNLMDDYKKYMQKSADMAQRFPKPRKRL